MTTFEPWLGNANATDQAKNDYIRRLKAALLDTTALKVESGSYTGDGSSPRDINLTDTDLTPVFVLVGDATGTKSIAMTFEPMIPDCIVWANGSSPATNATSITAFGLGYFTVNNNTYTNANSSTYYYLVYGS